MKRLFLFPLLGAVLVLNAAGCSMFGGKPADESPAAARGALEVPPDLARPAGDDMLAGVKPKTATASGYVAGNAATTAGAAAAAPAPATAATAAGASTTASVPLATAAPVAVPAAAPAARVQLERDGAQRWLVVQDTPDNVWAKARAYLLRNNYTLTVDNPKSGLLETDWIDRPVQYSSPLGRVIASLSSTGLRDRFRVRVEAGRVAGTSEVYVSHSGLEQVVTSKDVSMGNVSTTWQPTASDPQLEAELLDKLMVDFGLNSQQARNQLASAATPRAQLAKNALVLPQEDLDAAWRRVGQALDRSGVAIEDLDRNAGIYYVNYVSGTAGKKDSGLFGFLGSGSSSGSDDKNSAAQNRFQVALKTQADGTNVTVRDVKGEIDDSPAGTGLLNLLYQQLR